MRAILLYYLSLNNNNKNLKLLYDWCCMLAGDQ